MDVFDCITDPHDHRRKLDNADNAYASYKVLECENLLEYANCYLITNSNLLACSLIHYNDFCVSEFGLTPLTDISLSRFAFYVAHYVSHADYQSLQDTVIITRVKNIWLVE